MRDLFAGLIVLLVGYWLFTQGLDIFGSALEWSNLQP